MSLFRSLCIPILAVAATVSASLPADASAACCPVETAATRSSSRVQVSRAARPDTAQVGLLAPAFTLRDVHGRRRSLDDFAGKIVVLEWTNPNCPFVVRHYGSGGMQALQARYREKGVAWILVQSTKPDHNQYMAPGRLAAQLETWRSRPTATLMDPNGAVGRKYGARTTPHMYVIDASGRLVYAGAIDDDPRGDRENVTNHVALVLDALLAGRAVEPSSTTPYGCSVKY